MKLADREKVDGTRITSGRRVYYQGGRHKVSRRYGAEYQDLDGQQVCRYLKTISRTRARRLALEIQQQIESGTAPVQETNLPIDKLIEGYLQTVKTKGVAPKTEWKYAADLAKLKVYCGEIGLPLDSAMEKKARSWLGDASMDLRLEGVKMLGFCFKSDKNIELLKSRLADSGFYTTRDTKTKEQKKVYQVRAAAYRILKEWNVDVKEPILEERIKP